MELTTIITVILIAYFFYQRGKETGEKEAYWAKIKAENPYYVRSFRIFSSTNPSYSYFKTLDEALDYSLEQVTKTEPLLSPDEKAEVWHKEEIIKTRYTNHREPLEKLREFKIKDYDGKIYYETYNPIDIEEINKRHNMIVILTNGDRVYIEKPYYSLQKNAISGRNGIRFQTKNNSKIAEWSRILPVRVIEKIES